MSFLSKLIERIVSKELKKHLDGNNLLPVYQSGYKRHHSTKTALLHVLSKLHEIINNWKPNHLFSNS
uniref:Reverse transcriptase domain-containing protein n=1 Tax=Helobdella robusta TaxID=6412 RepID=T1G4A6_HELRO